MISHRAMSVGFRPCWCSSFCEASAGRRCSVESGPGDHRAADDLGERLAARGRAVVTTAAAAPSETWLALPAVIVPFARERRRERGQRLQARLAHALVVRRARAAATISSASRSRPAAALACERAASSSCASRRDAQARVLGVRHRRPCPRRRSSSTARRGPSRRSSACRPCAAPGRVRSACGARVIESKPPTSTAVGLARRGSSPPPSATALMLARQTSLSVIPGTVALHAALQRRPAPGVLPVGGLQDVADRDVVGLQPACARARRAPRARRARRRRPWPARR